MDDFAQSQNSAAGKSSKRTYTKIDFTLEKEESLINFVKENEPLFNPRHELYRNRIHRDNLWLEISLVLEKSGELVLLLRLYLHSLKMLNSHSE